MNPTAVSANSLFQAFRATLDLQWVAGLDAPERQFHESAVRTADSGSDLVDYLNYIHPYRLQVLGEREIAYLASAPDAESMQRRVHRLIELEPPAIIVADAQQPLPCLLEMADNAMVEKLAGVFDDVVTVGWEGRTALRMAWGEQINREGDVSLRQVFSMLNDPDTRRGIMLLLRVLQITGQRLSALSSVDYPECTEIKN